MKNLFLWYIPQAVLFFGGHWVASSGPDPVGGFGPAGLGLMLAAAYTGGANLVIRLWAWLRCRSALGSKGAKTSSHGLSLSGARSGSPKSPEQIDGVRIRE